ncbi:MAG: hypothetical protein HGB12_09940 [Bacteroidetes bacterium]|nr:hypothetical protein [Bacteroidota bacterium]
MKIKKYLPIAVIALSFIACKKEKSESNNKDSSSLPYKSGVFISCEGPFQNGTGTISFFNRSTNVVDNDIFEKVNNRPLGNIVQSITVYNDKGYITVNNAGKIEVVGIADFISKGTITGFTSPRYFVGFNSSKGYVSDMSGFVAVVDLNSNTITKKIVSGRSPDNMVIVNNKLFALNYGGWGIDSTITIINTNVDTIEKTIFIGYRPNSIKEDSNGKLWVMCGGKGYTAYPQSDDTEGHLLCLNTTTYEIEKDIPFPTSGDHPEHLVLNGSKTKAFYINNNMIYQFDLSSSSLNTTSFIGKSFYSIGLDNVSENLFAADPVDYSQAGWVFRYNSDNGIKIDSFRVGVIPGNFDFK